jgi:hypothetical protein
MKCASGKRIYPSQSLAEEALIDAHSRNRYSGTGPVSVYQCEECGYYHFTSKGPMNKALSDAISSGKIKLEQQANEWSRKWKK